MNKTTLNSQKEKHSTLSLRRATRYAVNQFPVTLISIHALLAESDSYKRRSNFFNQHFYPRSPCGERPPAGKVRPWASHISIHALLAESDILDFFRVIHMKDFYPRSPCGERPSGQIFGPAVCIIISIHALLAESDLVIAIQSVPVFSFLSTLSLRRATFVFSRMGVGLLAFLSTLSLRRATGGQSCNSTLVQSFYPRSPCGERRVTSSTVIVILRVSIHALLAESDDPA